MRRVFLAALCLLILLDPWDGGSSGRPEAGAPGQGPEVSTTFRSSVSEFEQLFHLIRATLSRDRVEFPGKTGPVAGFAAGTSYPQIWLRDAATIIPASRLFYPAPYLVSWIEEHLAFQRPDGSLEDWIDASGKADKNTTETDQEASAVLGAAQAVRILGLEWPGKNIRGVSILERLDRALRFVLSARFDKTQGLVTGAHTADWGDVDMEDADQKAIYTDAKTNWTVDIYDQAIVYGAGRALAELWDGRGAPDKVRFWRDASEKLRENADRILWQEDRGYYRVHVHLGDLKHDFNEDAMFPMGGNAEAILGGLASPEKARRIIDTALARQAEFKMPTLSAVLLPPYPKGVFKHPAVDEPFEYQNGGLWDWFGAKLVYAMFENGFSDVAREKLLEIARKNIANKGLYEWDAPDGSGRGSPSYAGSAGSLAKALFEGYFGVKLSPAGLELAPRLGEHSARANVRIPAAGVYAAFEYRWDPKAGRILYRYESNVPKEGVVRVTLPAPLAAQAVGADSSVLEVSLDGRPVEFSIGSIRRDIVVSVRTDFRPHTLLIERAR
jgi:hypothetical protein